MKKNIKKDVDPFLAKKIKIVEGFNYELCNYFFEIWQNIGEYRLEYMFKIFWLKINTFLLLLDIGFSTFS